MTWRIRTRKDGSTYTQVRYRHLGKESSLSFNDHAEALKFQSLLDQVGPTKALEISRITVSTDYDLTVGEWLRKHNESLTGIEPGTLRRYESYVRNDMAQLAAIPLPALTRDHVVDWLAALRTPAGDVPSGKTIKNKRDYLSGALKAAVKAGHITLNPAEDVRNPRWDREEMVFLTKAEFALLLSEVPDYWKPLVEFLVASGCRWSEATALKPSAVDRSTNTARVTKAWKTGAGGYVLGVPKTKMSVRTINVPPRILDKLDYDGEWLFTNSGRGKGNFADGIVREDNGPVRIHSFGPNVWRPAVERARKRGLTKSPRIHDLRHTCASWLIQANRPLPAVQAHLGHENITTTISVYGHLDRSSGQDNAAAIDAMLD